MPGRVILAPAAHSSGGRAAAGVTVARQADDGPWGVERPRAALDVRALAVRPGDATTVYAGTQGQGVHRSSDGGHTWEHLGLDGHIVKALATSSAAPDTVWAGTKPARMFVSHDEGSTWAELGAFRKTRRWWFIQPAESPPTPFVHNIVVSPVDPLRIIVGYEGTALVRSDDGGETWTGHLHRTLRDCHGLAFNPAHPQWVYEGGYFGAVHSSDGGLTWTRRLDGLGQKYGVAVGADPGRPDVHYVSVSSGPGKAYSDGNANAHIFRTIGDGPWVRLGGGLPLPLPHVPYGLCTDPAAPGHVWAVLSNGTIWHSADLGDTWSRESADLGYVGRGLIMVSA